MNAQRQKTGGRQKGTPNKINASVKYMFKALMMNNYDLVEDSFQKAKPNERLTFIAKMTPFLCAKEQPSKNGGEWVMDQSMDHEWFQIYESDHLLRRKQRIEHEENYAIQDINSQYSYEWQMIHDACAQFNRLGMDGEDVKQMILKRVDEFFNEHRNDKNRVKENFRQRRENFMKIEQDFFNEEDAAAEETAAEKESETAEKEDVENLQSDQKAQSEESALQPEEDSRNTQIPMSQYPEEASVNPSPANAASNSNCLNPSTLDSAAAQSEDESQCLNPSTIDPKPSSQKPYIRHLRQQQHRPFYTAIANKRRR